MKFRFRNKKLGVGISGLTVAAGLLVAIYQHGSQAEAETYQNYPSNPGSQATAEIAVSNLVDQHIHSIVIRQEDIAGLLVVAQSAGSVSIESSAAFDNANYSGPTHTHTVKLRPSDLTALQNGQEVEVASESTAGHSHIFRFVTPLECQSIYIPGPTYVITPSCYPGSSCYCNLYPYAPGCGSSYFPPPPYCQPGSSCYCALYPSSSNCSSFSPSPSPSQSVSTSPSSSPSPSPSVSASASPSPSPSVSVTGGVPSPLPSASASSAASPGPSPSASFSPSPCSCLLSPNDPQCATECSTPGEPCFCESNITDASCSNYSSCAGAANLGPCIASAAGCQGG